jgi:hypothetical protein
LAGATAGLATAATNQKNKYPGATNAITAVRNSGASRGTRRNVPRALMLPSPTSRTGRISSRMTRNVLMRIFKDKD